MRTLIFQTWIIDDAKVHYAVLSVSLLEYEMPWIQTILYFNDIKIPSNKLPIFSCKVKLVLLIQSPAFFPVNGE